MQDFAIVYAALRRILAPYAAKLDTKKDDESELYLDMKHIQKNKKPLFFGAVQIKKSYVSFHLMPVYLKPQLLASLSPELKSRMQGKSCFNFSAVEPAIFKELSALTKAGYGSYMEQGSVPAPPARPNPSLKRSANGRPPGPVWCYGVHFHQAGPGILPSPPA